MFVLQSPKTSKVIIISGVCMPVWCLLCNSYQYSFKFHIHPEMKVHVIQLAMLSIRREVDVCLVTPSREQIY